VKTGVLGIYNYSKILDSGFRRNDGKTDFRTFYETINIDNLVKSLESRHCEERSDEAIS